MKKDQIFLRPDRRSSDFEFDNEVAEVFDDMLLRSVPFYVEQQRMINQIAKTFWIKGTHIYDLGCSTGTTLINLWREIEGPGQLFGYDNAQAMLERANLKIEKNDLQFARCLGSPLPYSKTRRCPAGTTHGISKIARRESIDPWGEYWRLTAQSARRLFEDFFPAFNVTVATYGNVLAAVASLHGLAVEEMDQDELDYLDPDYEVLIGIRAVKPRQ